MVILIKTLQLILALSVLIFIHELGHFLFARLFGIRVEKFYLFFDLKGKALFKFKRGETEYGIGWLPLGGYCKIAGMIDESMDLEQMKREPQKWEFRSHPAWQRLLVMAGGVLFNFILAILAFSAILSIWGDAYISNKDYPIYVTENSLAAEMGFKTGDKIISFDDYYPENFSRLQEDLATRDVHYAYVEREDTMYRLYIDQSMIKDVLNSRGMFNPAIPFVVDRIQEESANYGGELKPDDRIIAVGGVETPYYQDVVERFDGAKDSTVMVSVLRDSARVEGIELAVNSDGKIGVYPALKIVKADYGFLESIPAGFTMTFREVGSYLRQLKLLAQPSSGAYESVGSFITIGQVFPDTWNWYTFLYLLALLSLMLGVMNLLPIPALDGGHIVFLLYEIITRRKPSEKFLAVAQMVGMVLLLLLMFLAFGNDIGRLLH